MNLTEKVSALQSSAQSQLPALNTLKKTETALVLPFFDALGYDPFDVREVEPEFNVGLEEQGMKTVDYALKREGVPLMLIQCEEAKTDLGTYDNRFLFQHFDELGADVAVFTNGLNYRFYANLNAEIHTYEQPFLEFDLLDHDPEDIESLKRLTRSAFDTEELLTAAYDLKCGRLLRDYFVQQKESPDEQLVRFMAAQVYEADISEDEIARFRPIVQEVFDEMIGDVSTVQPTVTSREDEPATSKSEEEHPELPQGERSESSREERPESPQSEEEPKTQSSEAESPSDEGESFSEALSDAGGDEEDPFEKDLARRVIEDF